MRTIDTIRKPCVTVTPETTVARTAELMESAAVGSVVVVDETGLAGIVTDRDLVCRVLARRGSPEARIDSAMTSPVITVDADADVHQAYRVFHDHAIRRLVVMDGSSPVGVISVDDLVINLASELGDLVRPVTAEVIFGHHDPAVPMVAGSEAAHA